MATVLPTTAVLINVICIPVECVGVEESDDGRGQEGRRMWHLRP